MPRSTPAQPLNGTSLVRCTRTKLGHHFSNSYEVRPSDRPPLLLLISENAVKAKFVEFLLQVVG